MRGGVKAFSPIIFLLLEGGGGSVAKYDEWQKYNLTYSHFQDNSISFIYFCQWCKFCWSARGNKYAMRSAYYKHTLLCQIESVEIYLSYAIIFFYMLYTFTKYNMNTWGKNIQRKTIYTISKGASQPLHENVIRLLFFFLFLLPVCSFKGTINITIMKIYTVTF